MHRDLLILAKLYHKVTLCHPSAWSCWPKQQHVFNKHSPKPRSPFTWTTDPGSLKISLIAHGSLQLGSTTLAPGTHRKRGEEGLQCEWGHPPSKYFGWCFAGTQCGRKCPRTTQKVLGTHLQTTLGQRCNKQSNSADWQNPFQPPKAKNSTMPSLRTWPRPPRDHGPDHQPWTNWTSSNQISYQCPRPNWWTSQTALHKSHCWPCLHGRIQTKPLHP